MSEHLKKVILKELPTGDLLQELRSREGVDQLTIHPYHRFEIKSMNGDHGEGEGPASILVINDAITLNQGPVESTKIVCNVKPNCVDELKKALVEFYRTRPNGW